MNRIMKLEALVLVFIDNLPEDTPTEWLRSSLCHFGKVVVDAFIP